MPAAYTDAAAVAAALRLEPDTTLAAPVSIGDQSISLSANQVAGGSSIEQIASAPLAWRKLVLESLSDSVLLLN